ncbi:hypothetical protein ACFO5O_07650 [Geojedonia litorea]|uniref:Uncharacterized protein n=1 Tax=Geojedonia litorea TaxID=1268269 RepID=A0ABV9N3L3_9FLAO
MPAITITASNSSTGTLTLSDNGSTVANRGQIVTWIIGPNSGVSSITAINHDTNSSDVFDPDPAPVGGNSRNWQGTINPNLAVPAFEDYYIQWTDSSGNSHTYDPRISVNQ